MLVRDIESATLWARDPDKARSVCARLSERLGIPVTAVDNVADATADADVIITTTPSDEPVLLDTHVRAGQHITAMGSDAEHKNEIDPRILKRARYYCDRLSQVQALGELHHAIDQQLVAADESFPEIGQVIAGQATARNTADEITLCDLTGTGIQDTAIANLAYRLCQENQAGTVFNR